MAAPSEAQAAGVVPAPGDLGWMSKVRSDGQVAHYVIGGVAACTRQTSIVSPNRAWAALRASDHLCTFCRRLFGGECRCGLCSIRARTRSTA